MDEDWYWRDVGIYAMDTSADGHGDSEEAMEAGASVGEATKRILIDYADYLDDMDDEPDVYFALAAAQLQRGALQDAIRDKAIAFIDSGQILERWKDESRPKRQEVLQQFRALLIAGSDSRDARS
jgi:hypothetical protein